MGQTETSAGDVDRSGAPDAAGVAPAMPESSANVTMADVAGVTAAVSAPPSVEAAAPGAAARNEAAHAPSIAEQVSRVPTDPGCYLWKGAAGEVLYVGKAKNLRARMRQYVQLTDERPMVPRLMAATRSFDYVVVGSEHEALVLEINLIHQYRPPFNVDLKDDKSYPFIAITKGDLFPAIKYTRERHRADTRYFGPYTDARAARATIDVVRKVMPLCIGTCAEWKRVRRQVQAHPEQTDVVALAQAEHGRPCFDYHVGRGPGVCAGCITPEEYAGHVAQVERFLSGHRAEFVNQLKGEMAEAAANLDFERAGRVKRRLAVIDGLDDKQRVVLSSGLSGAYNSACVAAAQLEEAYPGRRVRVVDSLGASSGYGMLVDYVADLRDAGASLDEAYEWALAHRLNVHHWFFSTDLTSYIRGGRVSRVSGFVGTALRICPVLNMNDEGKLIPRDKIRTKGKAAKDVVARMLEHAEGGAAYAGKCAISMSACREDAEHVRDLVEAQFPALAGKVTINDIGTVIGSHTGPGTVALFFMGDTRGR